MPLATTDIVFRAALVRSDAAGNGGRMAATAVPDNVKNALFSDVRQAERLAGSERWRKLFIHFAPADLSQALDVRVIPYDPTPAGDSVVVYLGTHVDTQGVFTGALPARAYGVAMAASVSAGQTVVTATLEPGAPTIFVAGDAVYITDKTTVSSPTGAEEYATVASVGAPSGGTQVVTLAAPLGNSYGAGGGGVRLASVIQVGDVLPLVSGVAVVSATGGALNQSAVTLYPRSTVADTWTLTFTSASAFNAVGQVSGAVGSGTVGGGFGPVNTDFGGSFFSLGAGALAGTWAVGNTVQFTTAPASIPLWLRRTVPVNTMTYAANRFTLAVDLESA